MKTRFLSYCLGISAVLFSFGFLIRSIVPAAAAPTPMPEEFIQQGTSQIGRYMMSISPETPNTYELVFIWNTETGESAKYIKNNTTKTYDKSSIQLPQKPL